MKWSGGRNTVQGINGEYEPGSGFTYVVFLTPYPDLFQAPYHVWAHAESQPLQVMARLKIAELTDWGGRRVQQRYAFCELVVDGEPSLCVLPNEPVTSCDHAKRRAASRLAEHDFVEWGLRWYYGDARRDKRVVIEAGGEPSAVLYAARADWLLQPGEYLATHAHGRSLIRRAATSVSWERWRDGDVPSPS